jgi:hypothetical protein
MTEFLLFLAPFSWGHSKASGCCFQSERLLYGREPNELRDGTGKAEAAKLPDAGISPKQWPKKKSGRKRAGLLDSTTIGVSDRPSSTTEATLETSNSPGFF